MAVTAARFLQRTIGGRSRQWKRPRRFLRPLAMPKTQKPLRLAIGVGASEYQNPIPENAAFRHRKPVLKVQKFRHRKPVLQSDSGNRCHYLYLGWGAAPAPRPIYLLPAPLP